MEKLLMGLALGFGLLLGIAIVVAVWEQLRDGARLRRLRDPAHVRALGWQALPLDLDLPQCAAARPEPEPAAITPLPAMAEQRAPTTSTARRSARPAVGQPSSGWTETEPMVLAGSSKAHFDPTELSIH